MPTGSPAFSPPPLAILWDLDGTLIDSTQYHWRAWSAEMATRNHPISYAEFASSFGQRNDATLRRWINQELSDEDIQQISESKETRYRLDIQKYGLELLPGVDLWLNDLKSAGKKQALATMTGRINVETIFSVIPISQFFDAVVTGDEVVNGKPNPDIFLQAAAKLGIPAGRCLVIEDSLAGIEAAQRAGMKSIGVNHEVVLPADWSVGSLAKLSPNFL